MNSQVRQIKNRIPVTAMIGVATLVLLTNPVAVASAQTDPAALQKQGIARVTQYSDNSRRTGDRVSLLHQLRQAQTPLTAMVERCREHGPP